jgi:ABC-type sugar transport system ATPase subunit
MPELTQEPSKDLDLGVRPEHILLGEQGTLAAVHLVQPIGPFTYVTVTWEGGNATARVSGVSHLKPGDKVKVSFDTSGILFFDRQSDLRIELS